MASLILIRCTEGPHCYPIGSDGAQAARLGRVIWSRLTFQVYHSGARLKDFECLGAGLAYNKNSFFTERPKLLRAIIFDFDGIIVNSEPLIMKLTQQMAEHVGYQLSEAEYYHKYLALDDRGIAEQLLLRQEKRVDPARRDELVAWKARAYMEEIRDGLPSFPDAVEFVREMAALFPLAIASGSLRAEIEHLLGKNGLRDQFKLLVTADDVAHSKPDPEVFIKTLAGLGEMIFNKHDGHLPLRAEECLVIEDAAAGVDAAHAAGMKCMALAHSLPLDVIGHADWVFENFGEVDLNKILADFDQ
jgi:HAD superfamily hydrolase (TIGR01509 family)